MSDKTLSENQEIEVKFYLSGRQKLEARLSALGRLAAPRVHEVNLRLDTSSMQLSSTGQLLRLRRDTRVRLTYKGAGSEDAGARLRQELEITVSDFDTALRLLEALGFQVYMMYEKFRTTYRFGEVEAALDETPLGDFLELEGPGGGTIQAAASSLGLNWDARILDSYTMLFEQARASLGFTFQDLSWANFAALKVSPADMGIRPADLNEAAS